MQSYLLDVKLCSTFIVTTGLLYIVNKKLISGYAGDLIPEYNWFVKFCMNFLSYSTVLIPGYLTYKYVKKVNYLEKSGNGCIPSIIRQCIGSENDEHGHSPLISASISHQRSAIKDAFLLISCFLGLQITYLTWGILQEKVMTKEYVNKYKKRSYFTDSQFLVLINRVLAFCISGIILIFTRQYRHKAPLHKYIFCAFSNILSSWCQYEALKYVTFPSQVLAKAGKVIPVMIMSKIVSRAKYEFYEYVTAVILSLGMLFFMLDTGDKHGGTSTTTVSGGILLASYILFDSFTSNWQSALFSTYGVSSVQMMCAVNMFSCFFTAVSLAQQGSFAPSIEFMMEYPVFIIDCLLLSTCSAVGQLVIYFTIATFGAVVFTIIMTIRQGLAIFLSCLIYNHHISWIGVFGLCLVFLAVLLRIYCSQRLRKIKSKAAQAATLKV